MQVRGTFSPFTVRTPVRFCPSRCGYPSDRPSRRQHAATRARDVAAGEGPPARQGASRRHRWDGRELRGGRERSRRRLAAARPLPCRQHSCPGRRWSPAAAWPCPSGLRPATGGAGAKGGGLRGRWRDENSSDTRPRRNDGCLAQSGSKRLSLAACPRPELTFCASRGPLLQHGRSACAHHPDFVHPGARNAHLRSRCPRGCGLDPPLPGGCHNVSLAASL